MDVKFWFSYLTNPQNGFTPLEAKQFIEQALQRAAANPQDDFWTRATGLSEQERARMLNASREELRKLK